MNQLPNEILAQIVSYPYTRQDLLSLLLVDSDINRIARKYLTHIAVGPEETPTSLRIKDLQGLDSVQRIDHPISIRSTKDLVDVLRIGQLKHFILDMGPYYRKQETSLDEILLYLIRNSREGSTFTLNIFPFGQIAYSPGSLCILHQGKVPSENIWSLERLLASELIIERFTGWPQEALLLLVGQPLRELTLILDDRAFSTYPQGEGEDIRMILNLLTNLPRLEEITINTSGLDENRPLVEFWEGEKIIHYIQGIYPNIKRFNYPVSVWQLGKLKSIFPSVDWPILREITSRREVEQLRKWQDSFTGFQLIEGINYPRGLGINTVTVDTEEIHC